MPTIDLTEPFNGQDCGVKYTNKPHADSAYSHLPMRGIAHSKSSTRTNHDGVGGVYVESSAEVQKRNAIALWPELRAQRRAPVENQSKPHPDSAYNRLPLSGLGLEGENPYHKWTLTAAEKSTLADRPLRYVVTEAFQAAA